MVVYGNNPKPPKSRKPGLKKGQVSKKEKERLKNQRKVNRKAKKFKVRGNVQQGSKDNSREKALKHNAMIKRQQQAAAQARGDRNVGNVIKGLEAMTVRVPPLIPTGAVGNSYKGKN